VLAGEHRFGLELPGLPGEGVELAADVRFERGVLFLAGQLDQGVQVAGIALDRLPVGQLPLEVRPFLQQPLGLARFLPEGGAGERRFQFIRPLPQAVGVKDTSAARRAWCGAGASGGENLP
jgi:hypothetical protein